MQSMLGKGNLTKKEQKKAEPKFRLEVCAPVGSGVFYFHWVYKKPNDFKGSEQICDPHLTVKLVAIHSKTAWVSSASE
jgi:hypothetical protein